MISSFSLDYPASWMQGRLKDILIVLGSSILIALTGQIALPFSFTPVPVTLQVHMVLFMSVLLGSQRAVAAVALFLLQGALGLPVFSLGGFGILTLIGPTGGYLFGYLVAAFVTGWLAERSVRKGALSQFSAMAVGNLVIFACGAAWLSQFLGWAGAVMYGIAPFLIGDFVKLVIATRALQKFKKSAA